MCSCSCKCKPALRVGDTLYGYCYGYFGRDSYGEKRVEAIGPDWVVVSESGFDLVHNARQRIIRLYSGDPADLLEFTHEEQED